MRKALPFDALLLLGGLLPLVSCISYEPAYSAKAIEARVVDTATGQPLDGVIVVAHWELSAGSISARSRLVQLKILETVTDQNGRLFFAAWGPEASPAPFAYIEYNDPGILLFKSGYQPRVVANHVRSEPRWGALRHSDWDGHTIALTRASAHPDEYLGHFRTLNEQLRSIVEDARACDWRKIPRMLRAVHAERLSLARRGIRGSSSGIESVDRYLINNASKFLREGGPACGSPMDFLESGAK